MTGMKYKDFATEKSAYVMLNNFLIPSKDSSIWLGAQNAFEKFAKCGSKYNKKQNIILDLRQNNGGNPIVPLLFLYCLYTNYKGKNLSAVAKKFVGNEFSSLCSLESISSPVSAQANFLLIQLGGTKKYIGQTKKDVERQQKNPKREVRLSSSSEETLFLEPSKFNGKLIILTDRNCVSAGELTVMLAKRILGNENVIVIGENSGGMATIGIWLR